MTSQFSHRRIGPAFLLFACQLPWMDKILQLIQVSSIPDEGFCAPTVLV